MANPNLRYCEECREQVWVVTWDAHRRVHHAGAPA